MRRPDAYSALRLEGEVAIVTGAATGIGRSIAAILADRGAAVVRTDIAFRKGVALEGERIAEVQHDVADEASWQHVVAVARDRFGLAGILVNNAGILALGPITAFDVDQAERLFAVNVMGTALGMKTVAPMMTERGGGAIVNISSTAGVAGFENNAMYCATKWAIRGLSKAAALELGPVGIRVNTLMPGLIDTAMTRNPPNDWETVLERAKRHPLGRLATPEAVAEVVALLVSAGGAYCTGTEILIDGGEASMVGAGLNSRYLPA